MKETSPAHQHYPRDFCVETINMTPEACGIYVWLRGACWLDGSIPANIGELARACKTNNKGMTRAWSQMAHLFQKDGDRMIHPGMEALRKEQADNREKKSHAGKAGAESRWQTHGKRIADAYDRNALAMANDSSASASASATSVSTKNVETDPQTPAPIGACSLAPAAQPKSKKRNRAEVEKALGMRIVWWKEFWSIFPCHEGGLPGMDAFERKVRDEETWRAVKAGAIRYRERANADPEMRLKYAQGWLNDERWTDEARPREPPRSASKIDQAMEIFEEKYSGLWPPTEIR